MIVKIKRQISSKAEPYWQSFEYNGNRNVTVATVLDELNSTENLLDIEGNPAKPIKWECSCNQKMCGGCAMVINKTPALACGVFLNSIDGNILILEPLSKFPTIEDLMVDRSIIEQNLRQANVYIGEFAGFCEKEHSHQYSVAKCLKCGLCLEVCPNYVKGQNFFGALFANNIYLARSQSKDRKNELKKEYSKHFSSGCSKSLSCQRICPANIPTIASISKMNSLISK